MLETQTLPLLAAAIADDLAPPFAAELQRIHHGGPYAPRPRYLIASVLRDFNLTENGKPSKLGVMVVGILDEKRNAQ